jgi:aryl-alcohol dehydrogenase-like predicted oxidoreductase
LSAVRADEGIRGSATAGGTARFAARFAELPGHFRKPDRLLLSSIGLGTRPGDAGGADDLAYRGAVLTALERGVNVFDTALSYRMQRSERTLGAALRRAFAERLAARDEIVVITKGGFITVDPDLARDRRQAQRYLHETYVASGLVRLEHVVSGIHCFDPPFLRDQIQRSRRNLGLLTLDFYLLQDPELQLSAHGPDAFRKLLLAAFETLELAVADGWIAAYGVSTVHGLLLPHTERGHLSIVELFDSALEVGGPDHHLRAIELPYGVAIGDAAVSDSQFGPGARATGALDALADTGTAVLATLTLGQGRALRGLAPELRAAFPGLRTDAQRALQFARSTPGITTALVGMRRTDHVEENLDLARCAPAPPETIERLVGPARPVER